MRFKKRNVKLVVLTYAAVAVLSAASQFLMLDSETALVHNIALGVGLLIAFAASFRKTSLGVTSAFASGLAMAMYSLIGTQSQLLAYSAVYFFAGLIIPIMIHVFASYSRYLTVVWTAMARFVFLWLMAALVLGAPLMSGPDTVGWSELALSLLGGFISIAVCFWLDRRFPSYR